jgi:hypothetical protein
MSLPAGIQNVEMRAIRFPPEVVLAVEPRDLNVVTHHLALGAGQRFDLIIATNVFIYYDAFEHSLSLLNIGTMLASEGVFLSNDLLQDCPGLTPQPVGNIGVVYSARENDGDRVEIYSRKL